MRAKQSTQLVAQCRLHLSLREHDSSGTRTKTLAVRRSQRAMHRVTERLVAKRVGDLEGQPFEVVIPDHIHLARTGSVTIAGGDVILLHASVRLRGSRDCSLAHTSGAYLAGRPCVVFIGEQRPCDDRGSLMLHSTKRAGRCTARNEN